jgi:sarcosine oxidase
MPRSPSLRTNVSGLPQYDAIIIGLGVVGSAAAWRLARRGRRVLGVESSADGQIVGSSTGRSRIIRRLVFESVGGTELIQPSYRGWRELEAEDGAEIFVNTGALLVGHRDSPMVAHALSSRDLRDGQIRVLEAGRLAGRYPLARFASEEVGLWDPDAGVLLADRCVAALRRRATAHGATLLFATSARLRSTEDVAAGRPVTVDCGGRLVTASMAVVAAGPWLSRLLPRDHNPAVGVEQILCGVFSTGSSEGAAGPTALPILMWAEAHDAHAVIPEPGERVKVVKDAGRRASSVDDIARSVDLEELRQLECWLESRVPGLHGRRVDAAPCLYTHTRDGSFVVERMAGTNLVVAAACSGRGFKFAPALGELIADLVDDGRAPLSRVDFRTR